MSKPVSYSNPQGFVTNDPSALWPDREVAVCWDRTNRMQFTEAETRIKDHITSRFKFAGVSIKGWLDCPTTNLDETMLKPLIWRSAEGVDIANAGDIGYNSSGAQRPVEFGTTGLKSWCPQSAQYLDSNCLLNVALHEFGHVVGLHHELNRADLTNEDYCKRQQMRGELNTLQLGIVDRNSVMNYCRLMSVNQAGTILPLSWGDLQTVRALYYGPVAYISLPFVGDQEFLLPHMVSLDNLPIRIYGPELTEYQFAWAKPTEPCHQTGHKWSSWLPISKRINKNDLPKPIASYIDKPVKICVVGRSLQKEQMKSFASSVVVTFDNGESAVTRP